MGEQSLWKVGAHLEPGECHSEPFDKLRINSAKKVIVILSPAQGGTKDLEILRRVPLLRMTH
jgi:hypothetical protein